MRGETGRGDGRPGLRAAGILVRMGVIMALAVFAGYGLDMLLDSGPWFTVAGAAAGAVGVLADLVRAGKER